MKTIKIAGRRIAASIACSSGALPTRLATPASCVQATPAKAYFWIDAAVYASFFAKTEKTTFRG